MNTWSKFVVVGTTVSMAFGLALPTLAQTVEQQAVVVSLKQTDCLQLFATDPGVSELSIPESTGKPADGLHESDVLSVEISVTRGTRTEPAEVDVVSVANTVTGAPPKPIKAALLHLGDGNTVGYIFPKGVFSAFDLKGPAISSGIITKIRLCTGGTTPTLASVGECPLTGEALANACAKSGATWFRYYTIGTDGLGLRDGEQPPTCLCPGASARFCDPSNNNASDACFPVDAQGNGLRKALATNVQEIVATRRNPLCTVHCFAIDGMRVCQEYCLSQ